MIAELCVLLGIQGLKKGRGWISPEVTAKLVDLVKHKHWVVYLALAKPLEYPAWHGTDIGPAVPPDLGLVPDSSKGYPDKLSFHGLCNGLTKGGLANTWRTCKADDLPL